MAFKVIPRQIPQGDWADYLTFIKMLVGNRLITGRYIQDFESDFARMVGVPYAVSVSSCRCAFNLILDALGIKAGDEVILPVFNMPAFPKILKYKGIKPVFVDIGTETWNINETLIEKNITPRTKAIVAVHLFGNVCDMEKIASIAHKHRLLIIEDCANSFMTPFKNKCVGSYGHAACFSLGHSKDVATFGGGMAITTDEDLYAKMKQVRDGQFTSPGAWSLTKSVLKTLLFKILTSKAVFLIFVYPVIRFFSGRGYDIIGNFIEEKGDMIKQLPTRKFTNFQAFIGLQRLKNARRLQAKRIEVAGFLNDAIGPRNGIKTPKSAKEGAHAYWNYPVLADDRRHVLSRLIRHGIDGKKIDGYHCGRFDIFK